MIKRGRYDYGRKKKRKHNKRKQRKQKRKVFFKFLCDVFAYLFAHSDFDHLIQTSQREKFISSSIFHIDLIEISIIGYFYLFNPILCVFSISLNFVYVIFVLFV